MPISSRVTLTAIQQERRKGLALQEVDLKFPVRIIPSTFFFKLLKQEKKSSKKKVEIKRSERWYEELHQATLPARQATATEKSHFVQWHVLEVSVSKILNIENH